MATVLNKDGTQGAETTARKAILSIEDAPHVSGEGGALVLAVRTDTAAALAGTTGDNIPLQTDATGNLRVAIAAGAIAEDGPSTASGAQQIALEARNTQKTAMSTTGDVVRAIATMDGKQIVWMRAAPELSWQYAAAASGIVSSVADVVLNAALATYRNYLVSIELSHDLLSAVTEFVIKDGATIIHRGKLQVAAVESLELTFDPPLRCTVNTALNFALLSSVTGGVYVNAQGFTAP